MDKAFIKNPVEAYEKLKAENEQYKKVISKLAGKTIAIITYDTPIEFCDHKDLTIQQLKKENEKLKEEKQGLIKDWEEKKNLAYEIACKNEKLKQILTEIKSILELYANSKVGEEQSDGTYKLSSGICGIQDSFGFCITTYDPRPARQALQKISEVIDDKAD